jgi:Domain of Unknown Function (DUF1259)
MRSKIQLFSLDYSPEIQTKALRVISVTLLLITVTASSSMAQVPEQARAAIDRVIGSRGTYIADERVYKVILPREAATIVQDYQTLSPNIGLNSWVAFMPAIHHQALLTGQLLLLEDEVDSVLTIALNADLEVTGLADSSLFFNGPRVKALDVMGVGTYQNLASAFRKALDETRRMRADASRQVAKLGLPELQLDSSIDPGPLNTILSMRGGVSEGVYRAAIGRRALLLGETVGREMGISTWIAFTGADDHALAHGEFAATSDELQSLLKALRSKNFKVTSIRNHTAGEHPQYLFVRFWQQGKSVELARGLRYALDVQVGAIATERSATHAE